MATNGQHRSDHALSPTREPDKRDRVAEERDRAADARDRAADARDRTHHLWSASERAQAGRDRKHAASDRAEAARDRQLAARDRESAGLDDLTGALRRDRGLIDIHREIDRARRTGGRLVVAFVDVDGLKTMNDTHGHAAGDQLLRDLVSALRAGLRSYDLVVRYGGDEFVCALPGADLRSAQRRFRVAARELSERNASASVSVGLAELESGDTVEALVGRADAALYARR
jgi:diguanylate cyclase (GGDEF)-like protein